MMTSNDLPTTVDYTNILVNYIEVSLDSYLACNPASLYFLVLLQSSRKSLRDPWTSDPSQPLRQTKTP